MFWVSLRFRDKPAFALCRDCAVVVDEDGCHVESGRTGAVVDKASVAVDRCSNFIAARCCVVVNIVSHVGLKLQARNDADDNSCGAHRSPKETQGNNCTSFRKTPVNTAHLVRLAVVVKQQAGSKGHGEEGSSSSISSSSGEFPFAQTRRKLPLHRKVPSANAWAACSGFHSLIHSTALC